MKIFSYVLLTITARFKAVFKCGRSRFCSGHRVANGCDSMCDSLEFYSYVAAVTLQVI